MNNKRVLIPVLFIIGLIFGIVLSPLGRNIKFFVAEKVARGSVTKDQADATKCAEKDTTCTAVNGKVEAKVLPEKDQQKIQKEFPSEQAMHVAYADNVLAAVEAIRRYTGVGNLDLHRLNEKAPINVSYYCTKDESKCWAVDNKTHKVIPHLR